MIGEVFQFAHLPSGAVAVSVRLPCDAGGVRHYHTLAADIVAPVALEDLAGDLEACAQRARDATTGLPRIKWRHALRIKLSMAIMHIALTVLPSHPVIRPLAYTMRRATGQTLARIRASAEANP